MKNTILALLALILPFLSSATISPIIAAGNICVSMTDTLSDTTSGGTWSSSNTAIASVGSTTGIVTGVSAGIATITYTVGGSYVTITDNIVSTVIPLVSISPIPGTLLYSGAIDTFTAIPVNGGSAPNYQWMVNGVSAGIGSRYSYIPLNGDFLTVCMLSNATCAIPDTACHSGSLTVTSTTGVNSIIRNEPSIYPNPTNNEITIEYSFANSDDGTIQITDIVGRAITEKKLSSLKQKEEIVVSDFSPGMYLYKVVQNNMLISAGKIVKE